MRKSLPQPIRDAMRDHRDVVYRLAFRVLRNAADAEDVVQDAFVKLLRSYERIERKESSSLRNWLARTAIHLARNRVRGEVLRRQREARWAEQNEQRAERESPHDVERLRSAIDSLDDSLRLPVLLHYEEGLRHREIGELLDLPTGTVSRRVANGRTRLKEKLGAGALAWAIQSRASAFAVETPSSHLPSFEQQILGAASRGSDPAVGIAASSLIGRAVVFFVGVLAIGTAWWILSEPDVPNRGDPVVASTGAASGAAEEANTNPRDAATPKEDEPSETIAVAEGTLWEGVVRDEESRPLAGVDVRLMLLPSGATFDVSVTDDNGAYRIESLPEGVLFTRYKSPKKLGGTWEVQNDETPRLPRKEPTPRGTVDWSDDRPVQQIIDGMDFDFGICISVAAPAFLGARSEKFSMPPERVVRVDFKLASAGEISGRVLDKDGQPLAEARIAIVGRSLEEKQLIDDGLSLFSGDDGRFVLDQLPEGHFIAEVSRGGFVSRRIVLSSGDHDVDIALAAAADLRLEVVRAVSAEKILGVEVVLDSPDGRTLRGDTDVEGRVGWEGLTPGSYSLSVLRGGFPVHEETFRLASGVAERRLSISDGVQVRGRVRADAEFGERPFLVTVAKPAPGARLWTKFTTTNEAGEFSIDGIPSGRFVVRVRLHEKRYGAPLDQRWIDVGSQDYVLDLTPTARDIATRHVKVVDAKGASVHGALVSVLNMDGVLFTARTLFEPETFYLPPGEYRLRARAGAHDGELGPIHVAPRTEAELSLKIPTLHADTSSSSFGVGNRVDPRLPAERQVVFGQSEIEKRVLDQFLARLAGRSGPGVIPAKLPSEWKVYYQGQEFQV
ncbi:MAG: sigma-70 family RNA polymerase sigma factor, partial [Planctomycetota bacterium]